MRAITWLALAVSVLAWAAAPTLSAATSELPASTTGPASSVTASSAQLGGSVNPNGSATTYSFQYGATTAYGSQTAAVSAGSGTSPVAASATLTGLAADTTYHYRLVATSAGGPADGNDATFTTARALPGVATGPAAGVTGTSAVLNATVNPEGRATNYEFQYGSSGSYGLQTAAASAGSGTGAVPVKATITGLAPGSTYHFRAIATNPDGTGTGADAVFKTGAQAPAVVGATATVVTSATATLSGQVNPGGRATTYAFDYGPTTGYGSQTTFADAGSGTSPTHVGTTITGLEAGATYHYRLEATSAGGTAVGADASFVTTTAAVPAGAALPVVSGATAVAISATGAQLNGAINPSASHMTWYFEYGLTSAYGVETRPQTTSGLGARPVNVKLSGLEPGTTFHFRLVAQSPSTLYVGPDAVFATKPAPRLSAAGLTVASSARPNGRGTVVSVTGALRLPPSLTAPSACTGVVEVQVIRGADTVSLRSAPLRPDCSYGEQVAFARGRLAGAKRLRIAVHLTGNAVLTPTATRSTSVRA